jgi:hypothetical protein
MPAPSRAPAPPPCYFFAFLAAFHAANGCPSI